MCYNKRKKTFEESYSRDFFRKEVLFIMNDYKDKITDHDEMVSKEMIAFMLHEMANTLVNDRVYITGVINDYDETYLLKWIITYRLYEIFEISTDANIYDLMTDIIDDYIISNADEFKLAFKKYMMHTGLDDEFKKTMIRCNDEVFDSLKEEQ